MPRRLKTYIRCRGHDDRVAPNKGLLLSVPNGIIIETEKPVAWKQESFALQKKLLRTARAPMTTAFNKEDRKNERIGKKVYLQTKDVLSSRANENKTHPGGKDHCREASPGRGSSTIGLGNWSKLSPGNLAHSQSLLTRTRQRFTGETTNYPETTPFLSEIPTYTETSSVTLPGSIVVGAKDRKCPCTSTYTDVSHRRSANLACSSLVRDESHKVPTLLKYQGI